MNLHWLHADADGETHLTRVELPATEIDGGEGVERVRILGLPATHVTVAQLDQRVPDLGLHPAPRRRLLVLMTGAYEVTTTSGDRLRLYPGDGLFVDDVGTKGHYSDDVGEVPMTMASIDIPDDVPFPPATAG
jgi:hypothetical protein